jgi:fermentation-respiration switch protein FrsA (DUF1100 family)
MLMSILLTGLGGYALLVLFVYFSQARLIYYPDMPGRELAETPRSIGVAFEDVRFTAEDGVELHGWFVPGASGDRPAAILCHGNAGNISHRLDKLAMLHDIGLAVLLFDYRGYGQSSGSPTEQGTYRDAHAAWNYLTQRRGLEPKDIVLLGESLGGPIAAELAADKDPAALILVSTFTSAPDLARKYYWYLPVRLIARFHYPTSEYVARVRAPILVIHSRDDEIAPFAHGQELYRLAHEPKTLVEISGDHNAGFLMSEPLIAESLRRFLVAHGLPISSSARQSATAARMLPPSQ